MHSDGMDTRNRSCKHLESALGFSSFCGKFLPYFISFLSYIVAPLGKIIKYVKNLAKNEEQPGSTCLSQVLWHFQ